MDHSKKTLVTSRWEMELSSVGVGHAGIRVRGDGGLYWEAIEYGGTINRRYTYPGPLTGGRETTRGKGFKAVIGTSEAAAIRSTGGKGSMYG